ncbi:hypothetical protein ACFQV8_07290 [Pseudonocardia benzenivorans]
MTSRLVRILAATGTAAAVVLGLSACGVSVAKEDLAQSVTAKLAEQKVEAAGMTCPENLKGRPAPRSPASTRPRRASRSTWSSASPRSTARRSTTPPSRRRGHCCRPSSRSR